MTDRAPLGFPLLAGGCAVVTPADAVPLRALLDAGRRQQRATGYSLPGNVAVLLAAIDQLAAMATGASASAAREPVAWVGTATAAVRAGVSTEAVRKAAERGRMVARKIGRRYEVTEASLERWIADRSDAFANQKQPRPTAQRASEA